MLCFLFWPQFRFSSASEFRRELRFGEYRLSTCITRNSFVYAHKVHTLPWHNLDEPQYWGFASECAPVVQCVDFG